MKAKLLVLSTLFFTASKIAAFDTWEGTKVFAHFSFDEIIPIVLDLNEKHRTVSISEGSDAGHGTYQINNNSMEITLNDPVTTVNYSTILNSNTGMLEPTEVTSTLKSFTIVEVSKNLFEFNTKGESCYFSFNPNGQNTKKCVAINNDYNQKVFQKLDQARPIQTKFSIGDKIVLPIDGINMTYLEVLSENTVNSLTGDGFLPEIVKLDTKGVYIVATLKDGGSITYSRLAQKNGNELVIGVIRDSSYFMTGTTIGTIVIDENVNTLAIDFTGSYNAIGFGGLSSGSDEFLYDFSSDGFGGFESYDASSDESRYILWSWEATPTGMKASRWMKLDNDGNYVGQAETKAEIQACLDKTAECFEFQKREYKLIAKDGNKYVMFRIFQTNFLEADSTSYNYTLQYFYKK